MIMEAGTDKFWVDIEHGRHYHAPHCGVMRMGPAGDNYVELSLDEIRSLRTLANEPFVADGVCMNYWRRGNREVKVTYRGWPGHYILGDRCVFHLNTLLEAGQARVVVSSVGNLRSQGHLSHASEPIGSLVNPHYFETKAFWAQEKDGYWEAATSNEIKLLLPETVVRNLDPGCDEQAQRIHEAAVQVVTEQLQQLGGTLPSMWRS